MVIQQKMAYGIVGGLAEFYKSEEFHDFTVTLGEISFQCHRLLLAACSDFFRAMFRSRMQETEQKTVAIKGISSEIFELILETIYTGHGVLTNDNVIDIWRAAHQLQINFLVSECENFVINISSEENYAEYFHISNTLNSAVVLETLWPFVLKYFYAFYQMVYFPQLPMADVLRLVKSQNLETESEDDVIHAILKWAEFQDEQQQCLMADADGFTNSDKTDTHEENENCIAGGPARKKYKPYNDILTVSNNNQMSSCDKSNNQGDVTNKDVSCKNLTTLLSHVRTYLVSQRCLKLLDKHPLVRDNKEARDIVSDALRYHQKDCRLNGQWPSRAVYRKNSKFLHCLVNACGSGNDMHIGAYLLECKDWLTLPGFLLGVERFELFTIDLELFVICHGAIHNQYMDWSLSGVKKQLYLSHLCRGNWNTKHISPTMVLDDFCIVAIGFFVYIFSAQEEMVWKLDAKIQQSTQVSNLPGHDAIAYMMPYDQSIFVCYAATYNNVDKTVVHCYDTTENSWNQLNNLEGPANGMTSFKDDHFTYLLQSNGKMWKVVKSQSGSIDFELVVKLWSCNWPLQGAVTYLDELYIHGAKSDNLNDDLHLRRSLPGVFSKINYIRSYGNQIFKSIPFIVDREIVRL